MRIPRLLILALGALLILPACSSSPATPPEKFTLAGQAVEFSPPPATWSKTTQEVPRSWDIAPSATAPQKPEDLKTRELPGGDVVRFTPSWPDGLLTVSALADWTMKSWAEDPEKTKAHVEHLQDQVLKRTDGKILRQVESKLGGETALRMEFRYMDGTREMKGVQVHALHQGAYWSVALLCPADHYREGVSVFDVLVDSFKFQ